MRRFVSITVSCAALSCALTGCEADNVEYGAPGGLQLPANNITECALPNGVDPACANGSPAWAEVYGLFDSDTYGCTSETCHGAPSKAAGLHMPADDPIAGYDNMRLYEALDGTGRKYIDTKTGAQGYLLCNLNPDPAQTIGTFMPIAKSAFSGADLQLIGQWYACDEPLEGGMGGVGGGGNGGDGGAAGVAGAGGM